eukprot:Polyplicarium_translucidae@DN3245_c0_g1_i2.p1
MPLLKHQREHSYPIGSGTANFLGSSTGTVIGLGGGRAVASPGREPSSSIRSLRLCPIDIEKINDRLGLILAVKQCVTDTDSDGSQVQLKDSAANLDRFGVNEKIQTKVQVVHAREKNPQVVFSVKHTDGQLWGRQIFAHRNLLLAATIARVKPPLFIPPEALRQFEAEERAESVRLLDTYMEAVMPHFRVPIGTFGFWYRAAGIGMVILASIKSGKWLLVKTKEKSLKAGARCAARLVDSFLDLPQQFAEPHADYPAVLSDEEHAAVAATKLDSGRPLEVLNAWFNDDQLSDAATHAVVRERTVRGKRPTIYRFSLGCVERDLHNIRMHVHYTNSATPEGRAFPYSDVKVPMHTGSLASLRLSYLRAKWFLRKLAELHVKLMAEPGCAGKIRSPSDADKCVSMERCSNTCQ